VIEESAKIVSGAVRSTWGAEVAKFQYIATRRDGQESDIVVAHNLVGTPGPPVCQPSPCIGAGNAVPQRVTLTVVVGDPANPSPITVTLTGQRGQS
jgi:hypothetical protein